MASSGKTPFLAKAEIERLGFKLMIYPNWLMLAAIKAASQVLVTLKKEGTIAGLAPQLLLQGISTSSAWTRCRRWKPATGSRKAPGRSTDGRDRAHCP